MKTALKLNKKELLSLYEKSNDQIKKTLCMEFGEDFFVPEQGIIQSKVKSIPFNIQSPAPINKNNLKKIIDWEAILDGTSIYRIIGYAYLLWLIF